MSLGTNATMECSYQIGRTPAVGKFNSRCTELRECVELAASSTVLQNYDAWPVFERLVPWSAVGAPLHTPMTLYTPISEMRANAARIGPEGQKMFALIYDIRRQCLVETGLAQHIEDE